LRVGAAGHHAAIHGEKTFANVLLFRRNLRNLIRLKCPFGNAA
jgi:hypothetical protein